eukprot:TCALIF_12754-PA protein Name:"Protein of unknown function" AED:0.30 eAED:0.30 QI:0/-1/0/1/-1/1/1/0/163
MTLVKFGQKRSPTFRCPSHKGERVSQLKGSFWEKTRISIPKTLMLAWLWSYKTSVSDTCSQTGVAAKAVGQWFSFYRDVCSHWLEENPYKIGGPGVIVEIDESVIAKRKYHRGRLVRERWVFGGYCPSTRQGFLVMVDRRDAATLEEEIRSNIQPGSIIISDE